VNIDTLKLYKSLQLDSNMTGSIDCISASNFDKNFINPIFNTNHRFKMKTKRLRKKLYKNPYRYYNKTFADMLVYVRIGNKICPALNL